MNYGVFSLLILLLRAPAWAAVPVDLGGEEWLRSSTVERIERLSAEWQGLPYLNGPLGEGSQGVYDRDPLYRFDGFDCVTYVETLIALAHAESESEFATLMDRIRYRGGVIGFTTRNHFPDLDWIPNNVAEGFFDDVTPELGHRFGGAEAIATIDRRGWYARMSLDVIQGPGFLPGERELLLPRLRAEGDGVAPLVSRLPYLPFPNWLEENGTSLKAELIAALPEISMVDFVRPGWNLVDAIGTELNVSHQGLLFKRGGDVYLRHATSDSRRRVVEDRLADYIVRNLTSPTLKGIHVLKVRDRLN